MPSITWQYIDDNSCCLTATDSKFKYETTFIELLRSNCLMQINNVSNSFGKFLDLVIVSDFTDVTITRAFGPELLDQESGHHPAIILNFTYVSSKPSRIPKLNYSRVNLTRSQQILEQSTFYINNITDH